MVPAASQDARVEPRAWAAGADDGDWWLERQSRVMAVAELRERQAAGARVETRAPLTGIADVDQRPGPSSEAKFLCADQLSTQKQLL